MMRWHPCISLTHLSLIAALLGLPTAAGWDRTNCLKHITTLLNSSEYTPNPAFFISASQADPVLTLNGCYYFCDSKMRVYSDAGPRIITWFLPIILLLANLQFAPIGRERWWMMLHLLGDPIDSIWSMMLKVDDWSRCYDLAEEWYKARSQNVEIPKKSQIKNLATVLSVAEELIDDFKIEEFLPPSIQTTEDIDEMIWRNGSAQRDNRANENLRTLLAILLYAFQLLAAFVPAVGQSSSPSGGRIGPAMLLSWLLPVVLLSNAVGDFCSRRNCRRLLEHFIRRIGKTPDPQFFCSKKYSRWRYGEEVETEWEDSLAWSGAIYSYRAGRRHLSTRKPALVMAFIATLPVLTAFGLAFAVLDTAPTYFSCRHLLVIMATFFWFLSAIMTWCLPLTNIATGKYLWYLTLFKDGLIATPIISLILATNCGFLNSCYCYSGALVWGPRARVDMNPVGPFNRNNHVIYPAMLAVGLAFQVASSVAMLWVGRKGFVVMWWGDGDRRFVYPGSKGEAEREGDKVEVPMSELTALNGAQRRGNRIGSDGEYITASEGVEE